MHHLVKASLFVLAIGLFTSISLLSLFHILIFPPIVWSIYKFGIKKLPKSSYAMLAFAFSIVLSIVFNQDVIGSGYKYITKIKYYVIGTLSIVPIRWYLFEYLDLNQREKLYKQLGNTFLFSILAATVSGLIGYTTGFNPLKFKEVQTYRNAGMFGMIMTYGHQAAIIGSVLIVMLKHVDKVKKYISKPLVVSTALANIIGLVLSFTRGAILAFLSSVIFLYKKIGAIIVIVFIVGGAIFAFTNPDFMNLNVVRKGSNEKRMSFWIGSLYAFKERPVLGYGYKNYEPNSAIIKKKYNVKKAKFIGHAHNNFLEVLATTGLLGFMSFITWLILWFRESLTQRNFIKDTNILVIATFVVGGLTQSTFIDGENLFLIFAIYSITSVYYRRDELDAKA